MLINLREEKNELANICAASLPTHPTFPYTLIMTFSRNSSCTTSAVRQRYKAYRLQADVLKGWIAKKQSERQTGMKIATSHILITQSCWTRRAGLSLRRIPKPTSGYQKPETRGDLTTATIKGISKRDVHWMESGKAYTHWKMDSAALLLIGATALTVGPGSWIRPGEAHGENKKPTKLIIFEPTKNKSPLLKLECSEDIRGGYSVFEFDLSGINILRIPFSRVRRGLLQNHMQLFCASGVERGGPGRKLLKRLSSEETGKGQGVQQSDIGQKRVL